MVEFQPRSGISTVLDSVAYFYVRIPYLPCYSSPHCSYHTRSSLTRALLVADPESRLPALILPSPGSHSMTPSPYRLLLISSYASNMIARSCFSVNYLCHHAPLLKTPPLYPLSPAHTLNNSNNATHCAMVACCLPMQIISDCVYASSRTYSTRGVSHVLSINFRARLPVICRIKTRCVPSTFHYIAAGSTQVLEPNISTACITTLYNIYDIFESAPSCISSVPNLPLTMNYLRYNV